MYESSVSPGELASDQFQIMDDGGRRPNPTAEQWEDMRPVIERLYLDEGRTLAEVRAYMLEQYDFRASERMYKSRTKKWEFWKNAKDPMYVYLQRIYDERKAQEKKTVFMVTRGKKRVTLDYDDIKKHHTRVKEESREHLTDSQLEELNARHEIVVITPNTSPKLASRSLQPGPAKRKNSGESVKRKNSDVTGAPKSSGEKAKRLKSDEDESRSPTPSSSASSSSVSGNTGEGVQQARRNRQAKPTFPSAVAQRLVAIRPHQTLPQPNLYPKADSIESRLPHARDMAPIPQTELENSTSIAATDPASYNLASTFAQLSVNVKYETDTIKSRIGAYTGSDVVGRETREVDADEELAFMWANEYITSCSNWEETESERQEHRRAGMECFKTMIRSANRYILPGLNWMTSILGSLDTEDKSLHYKEFLLDSCQAIDEHDKKLPYSVLYQYCLAHLADDKTAISDLGPRLENSRAQIRVIWGEDSPNMLVCNYYCAWHQLHTGGAAVAPDVYLRLQQHLAMSERLMGHHNLMTVNCLAIISRTLETLNDLAGAHSVYQEAIMRSNRALSPRNPYRLRLLQRLAILQSRLGHLEAAERSLREVYEGRIMVLGWNSGATWGALADLSTVLRSQGKLDADAKLRFDADRRYYSADHAGPAAARREQYLG